VRIAVSLVALLAVGCGSSADETSGPADATIEAQVGADASLAPQPDAASSDALDAANAVPPEAAAGCQPNMVRVASFCVDQFEAYVVEIDGAGNEHAHSPYDTIDAAVRAKTARGVPPQGYISQVQATAACNAAGKRLCTATEFSTFCRGGPDSGAYYPYGGTTDIPGYCNEGKGSSMPLFFGSNPQNWTYADFNDPRLNQWDGGLAYTGTYPHCVSPFGVYDCMGNLHEWGADPADVNGHGRFRGGFYGDSEINGPGCLYVTSAHELAYHDYSTGFRCCMDATGSE
jgi:sulfatase modifying factor 1